MFSRLRDFFTRKTYVYLVVQYDILTHQTTKSKVYSSKKLKKKDFARQKYTWNYYYTKEVYLLYIFKGTTKYED